MTTTSRGEGHRRQSDSVCIQVVTGGERGEMVDLPLDAWRTLAPALTSVVSR